MLRAFFATVAFLAVTTQAVDLDALKPGQLSDESSPSHEAWKKWNPDSKPAPKAAPKKPMGFVASEVARIDAKTAA